MSYPTIWRAVAVLVLGAGAAVTGTAQIVTPTESQPTPATTTHVPLTATPALPSSLDRGFRFMYDLKFTDAQQEFTNWQHEHPADPMGKVAEAAGLIFSEFNRLGVLESQFFVDDKAWDDRPKLSPDAQVKQRFDGALDAAERQAQATLAKNANDENALFAMAACSGLRADYTALIEKRNMASLGYTKQGSQWANKLLALDPGYYDAYIAIGITKYLVGTQMAPVRWFLRLGGYNGDKEGGMRDLKLAAERGRYLAPFARILLAIAYLREKDKPSARQLLASLQHDFPENPLFAREIVRLDSSPTAH
jgi:hypothetical protein